ncbi:MAG: hypothetical protein U9Q77_14300, partial [Candidatus Marinimicrobia bacterium]|nr:hypothetical protein [Candidatus Neomarinimicrobiota bacterium]
VAGTMKSWGHVIEVDALETVPSVHINAPQGVTGIRDLFLSVQLFKNGVPLSSIIERVLKVNIEDVDALQTEAEEVDEAKVNTQEPDVSDD